MGFFNLDKYTVERSEVASASLACGVTCKLNKGCPNPRQEPMGEGKTGNFIILDKPPSDYESYRGKFTAYPGKAGVLLRNAGICPDGDYITLFSVRCRPLERDATSREAKTCSEVWKKEVLKSKPSAILIMGSSSLEAWVGDRFKKDVGGVARWRGFAIPDRTYNCWVVVTYSPETVLAAKYDDDPMVIQFNRDVELFQSLSDVPLPEPEPEPEQLVNVTEAKEAISLMRQIKPGDEFAFDYETTGIKPHASGHDIISCAIFCPSVSDAPFAFEMKDSRVRKTLVSLLKNPKIKKIAANAAFEDSWSRAVLGVSVRGVIWDTMITAHVIDNRPSFSGLKFQSVIHFGIFDYDSKVHKYLRSGDEEGGNSFNRIREAPITDVLIYNGMDAFLEYRLYQVQKGQMGYES